ncbi:MAG: AAC(3) family N-acetyltransferase [Acidimicrobiia bacterium]|nr:AAC(3) family N-acetyltransferase [Acidimicrobiia bacterium]
MTVVTAKRLLADLDDVGLADGSVVIVHCSLAAIGRVPGGEQTVALALRRVIGPHGTIVVPTQSWHLCDPAYLGVEPEEAWDEIRDSLPAYVPRWTPTRAMGLLADAVRTHPAALRSSHPHRSFAAWGPAAEPITAVHALDDPVGEGSPLAALYDLAASILMIGVGFDKCTALHLAESRSGLAGDRIANGAPLMVNGQRQWVEFTEPAVDDSDFVAVGEAFAVAEPDKVSTGRVGCADTVLVELASLIDFAAEWMAAHRKDRRLPTP